MATASSALRATAIHVRAVPKSGLIAAARAAKQIAADEGRAAGSPLVGKKRRGLKLRAVDDIGPYHDGMVCRIQGVAPSGWVWVSVGTDAHDIRRRKRGPKKRMTVRHPGTSGRGGWPRVHARLEKVVPEVINDALVEALRR